jgi:hypothetical protein
MKIAAATTFSLKGYNEYAYRLLETFDKYWDKSIDLYVYYDEMPPGGWKIKSSNIHYFPLDFIDLYSFKERNKKNPKASTTNFMLDGVRFSHKVYAYVDLALNKKCDIAVWLDADIITHTKVTEEVVLRWLNGKMAGALFRPQLYTETGFHVFDMRHPQARDFMKKWINWYNTDKIWTLPAFTDCHTYDETVKEFDIALWNNLSPSIKHPHPFVNGILGEHMDHAKGPRKEQGHSKATDLVVKRNEDYWKKLKR